MNLETLIFEKKEDVGIIQFNRPKANNALNEILFNELDQLVDMVSKDDEIKVIILTGGEKVFAAGTDIKHLVHLNAIEAESFITLINSVSDKIADIDKPTIAAIAGYCLGGGFELALACDILIASTGAKFGQPEVNIGIVPGGGGTQRLVRLVGPAWGKRMIMTGEFIDVEQALNLGLITEVVEPEQLISRGLEIAQVLKKKAPNALRLAKRCVNYGQNVDLASGLEFEQKIWALLFSTEDKKEGMEAFVEKRSPNFIGK